MIMNTNSDQMRKADELQSVNLVRSKKGIDEYYLIGVD